ncbi:MAG: hypothetical protein DIU78_004130 [Pseudomonadota bacterium]
MANVKIDRTRISRIFRLCVTPAAASKAAERVFEVAKRRHAEARALRRVA